MLPYLFRLSIKKTSCQSLCVFPETRGRPCCFLLATFFILQKCRGSFLWVWLKDSSCCPYLSSGTIIFLLCWASLPPTPCPFPSPTSFLPSPVPSYLPSLMLSSSFLFFKNLYFSIYHRISSTLVCLSKPCWSSLRPTTFMSSPRAYFFF